MSAPWRAGNIRLWRVSNLHSHRCYGLFEEVNKVRLRLGYLSTQMQDILVALKTCAGNSRYLLPSRYDADAIKSRAAFNRVYAATAIRSRRCPARQRAFWVEGGL